MRCAPKGMRIESGGIHMSTKRPRLSAEETRHRLRAVGVEALCQSGMSIGLDAVNLEQAVRDADVSRSSAYAAWANDEFSPQEAFQRSVLMHTIESRKVTLDDLTSRSVALFDELRGTMSMRDLMREIIRQTAQANLERTADSIGWKLVIAIGAALHSAPPEKRDEELAAWMNQSANSLRQYTIERLYKPLGEAMGLVPRPQYGDRAYELGEVAIAAVSDGFTMRYWLETRSHLDGLEHHAVEGGPANWSLYSMIFEQCVEMFFVPKSGSWDNFE